MGHLPAALVFLMAVGIAFPGYFEGIRTAVPTSVPEWTKKEWSHPTGPVGGADHRFVTWLIARNAQTLASNPTDLFDAGICYPAPKALAQGEPGIALGLLGVPGWLLTRDPIATVNSALILLPLISALSMYLLVLYWTGSRPAGISAGLIFAFHRIRIGDIVHPYIWDNTWTVWALLFALLLFERAQWRWLIAFLAAVALQMGASFYALVGGSVAALPFGIWLVWKRGLRAIGILQWAALAVGLAVVTAVVYGPYIAVQSGGSLEARSFQVFLPWAWLLPGEGLWPGWFVASLGLVAVLFPGVDRGRDLAGGRWAFLAGLVLVLVLATGGNAGDQLLAAKEGRVIRALPSLYAALAEFVPGFASVRVPLTIASGAHLVWCLLAGLGAAALLARIQTRFRLVASCAIVLVGWVAIPGPAAVLPQLRTPFAMYEIRPPETELAFFAELERIGNSGPILELPPGGFVGASRAVLRAAWHRRPTSSCLSSYEPREVGEVQAIAAGLPGDSAQRELARLGFTVVVVRHVPGQLGGWSLRTKFDKAGMPVVLRTVGRTAYDIRPRT